MVLAEVDTGDAGPNRNPDFDGESTDNESELTDVTMPSHEIIRLLAQYSFKHQIWKKSEAKTILEYHIV